MSIDARLYVIAGIFSTALAQIALKQAGSHPFLRMKWGMWLLFSILSYVISFGTYYLALKNFEISKIQPIMMAGIISLISLYGFAAGEDLNRLRLTGILLSAVSILLISKS